MALLRNRPVQLLGPAGPEVSPTWEVRYSDGTKEQTPLKNIQLSDTELKQFTKEHGEHLSLHVRPVSDKEHQEIVDNQNVHKIKENQKKQPSDNKPVQVPTFVKPSDVKAKQ